MKKTIRSPMLISGVALALAASYAAAQDWPQWRGPDRDAKASSFTAPKSWPKVQRFPILKPQQIPKL